MHHLAGNDEIESQLKRDRMMAKNEIKMLLLGAGESGKSTVLKQMKLIHLDGYNAQERDAYKEIIYSNTIQSMRCVVLFFFFFFSYFFVSFTLIVSLRGEGVAGRMDSCLVAQPHLRLCALPFMSFDPFAVVDEQRVS
jgi:energy-coupling factor transporter ATP-binding protein EcfA2